MGDQDDLPLAQYEEMQQQGILPRSQPVDKLDREIEEIRELMLGLAKEFVRRRRINRG
jgi:hypothetical protein